MHTYTILRALVLSLGTASVIARSLPGRRSEVNARVAGGHESSNTSKNPEAADANVDTVVSSATTSEHSDILTPSADCPCLSLSSPSWPQSCDVHTSQILAT